MQTVNKLELVKVKRLAESSGTAKILFKILAERDRFRRFTDITHWTKTLLEDGFKIVEDEVMQVMKGLEAAGAGVVIYGRHGKHDRFEWFYNLKPLAKYAIGELDARSESIAPLPKLKNRTAPKVRGPNKATLAQKAISSVATVMTKAVSNAVAIEKQVIIPLVSGQVFKITLPVEITSQDLKTICDTLSQA